MQKSKEDGNWVIVQNKNEEDTVQILASTLKIAPEKANALLKFTKEFFKDTEPETGEYINAVSSFNGGDPKYLSMLIANTKYYISIKFFTLQMLAFILDRILGGAATFTLASQDMLKRWLWKIGDGHYCILTEIMQLQRERMAVGKTMLIEMISKRDECSNRSEVWGCPYLSCDSCRADVDSLTKRLDEMVELGIVKIVDDELRLVF